jgi:sucrose phosphorylase
MATFFNILDTHDGIGLMGAKEILSREDIALIIKTASDRGAYISYKMGEDRAEEPYEINTTWWSAVNRDGDPEDIERQVKRYVASRSIALVIQGVPGIYVHGFMGTVNEHDRVKETGVKRDVNRGFIISEEVERELADPRSKISLIRLYSGRLCRTRTMHRAFHPRGRQKVLEPSPHVFAVVRQSPERDEHILAITNVTGREIQLDIPLSEVGVEEDAWQDLLSDVTYPAAEGALKISLEAYGVLWLKPRREIKETGRS